MEVASHLESDCRDKYTEVVSSPDFKVVMSRKQADSDSARSLTDRCRQGVDKDAKWARPTTRDKM